MASRFVLIDHDTPMLLPPDLRDWVPGDHLVHFIMEAVGLLDLRAVRVRKESGARGKFRDRCGLLLLDVRQAAGEIHRRPAGAPSAIRDDPAPDGCKRPCRGGRMIQPGLAFQAAAAGVREDTHTP
jgi:hypothetical protein